MLDRRDEYDASGLLGDPDELRKRADENGFLFFKGLLPAEPVLELRRMALELIQEEGLLDQSSDLMAGVVNRSATANITSYGTTCVTKEIYQAIQRLPLFHELAHHPSIVSMYGTLFGEQVLVHPRHIMRLVVSGENVYPTAPHQDVAYIHGTLNTWTSWVPLGDCPMELGNLCFLTGSHTSGVLPVSPAGGAGGLACDLSGVEGDWIHFNFEAGDLVTFPATTVHKALPTQLPDRVRLSVDYRYQPISEPVHEDSLNPHMNILEWDDIYANWPNDQLKYYWKKQPITTTTVRSFDQYPQLKGSV